MKSKIRMIHIGKTGGSALKTMFDLNAVELKAKGFNVQGRNHSVTLEEIRRRGHNNIVFFVRHPVSRFVSAFNSRLRQGAPRYHSPWNRGERIAFKHFKEPNELAEALSAENWKVWAAANQSMVSIGHVKDLMGKWLSSAEFLEANRDILFYLGTTETMDEDVANLFAKMGIASPNKELDEVSRHVTPAGYSRTLSDKAVANLTQWYAKDIEIYEWCIANRAMINQQSVARRR